jgi:hypothetical protein
VALRDAQRCTATAKSTGERCKNPAVQGYTVCRMHGAGSPKKGKPGGRPIKTGRHSKWLPKDLLERYEEGLADPDLLALKDEIAALDARIGQVGGRLNTGEGPPAWDAVRAIHQTLLDAIQTGAPKVMRAGIDELGEAIAKADTEASTWGALYDLFDQRRKLVEGERRLEEAASQTITAREMVTLVAALVDLIRQHVTDQATLSALTLGIRNLISERSAAPSLN